MGFELTRKTIGDQWYQFELPGGGHAGVRKNGNRNWEVYWRDGFGKPCDPTPVGGDVLCSPTYDDALLRIRDKLGEPRPAGAKRSSVPDEIGFLLNRDEVARCLHPGYGLRFAVKLDNLTESEARSVFNHLRATSRISDHHLVQFGSKT